ncbi:MAG: hypothetical protein ACWGOX_10550, partial [Desulforhopalus sp.]
PKNYRNKRRKVVKNIRFFPVGQFGPFGNIFFGHDQNVHSNDHCSFPLDQNGQVKFIASSSFILMG